MYNVNYMTHYVCIYLRASSVDVDMLILRKSDGIQWKWWLLYYIQICSAEQSL